mgnify:CR=1 FL=1
MFAYYKDPAVMKYLTLQPHKHVDDTLKAIKQYLLPYEKRQVPQTWVIVWKENEKVIGNLKYSYSGGRLRTDRILASSGLLGEKVL